MSDGNGGEPAVVIERRSGSGAGVFLFGLALGAGLALLFAPQSGEETRTALARRGRRMKRKAGRLADSARDAMRDAAEDTRHALERRLARHHAADRDEVYEEEDDGV